MYRYATGILGLIASVIAADCPAWGLGCGDRRELATEMTEIAAKVSVDNAKTQRLAMEVGQSPNADHSADRPSDHEAMRNGQVGVTGRTAGP